jgi:hypothetical protein
MRNFILPLALTLLLSVAAFADAPEPINPERPGFTNGVGTLMPRFWQVEQGVARNRDGRTWRERWGDGGQVRVGFSPTSEVRLGLPTWQRGDGTSDPSLGAKWRFTPNLAVIGSATLARRSAGQIALEGEWPLTPKWTLQADVVRDSAWSSGLNFGYAIDARWSAFVERFRADGVHTDGGVTFLIRPDLQVDASVGDRFIAVGVAWRGRTAH